MKSQQCLVTIDQEIAKDIMTALDRHFLVDTNGIHVEVDKGIVSISGDIKNPLAFNAVERAVAYTAGVRDVKIDLNIDPTK